MNCKQDSGTILRRRCTAFLVSFAFLVGATDAQTPLKKSAAQASVQEELVRTENGFFEAWKTNNQAYFREHMLDNGIFWGEEGTFSRDQELAELQSSAKVCNVEGYGLTDFGALPLATGAYLLTYKAEEHATCNGAKEPLHMNGSSIYVFKAGRWQAIYRAQVALNNPG